MSWTGGSGTLAWQDAGNWNAGVLPGAGDDAEIGPGFAGVTVTSDGYVTIQSLTSAAGLRLVGGTFLSDSVQMSQDVILAGATLRGTTVGCPAGRSLSGSSA